MNKRDRTIFAVLFPASLMLCITLYWIGIDGPFILDDSANINQAVIEESSLDAWIHAAFSNDSGTLGRPVSALSFAFTSLFHGLDPAAFKYHNLLLHLLTGILLWLLGHRLLRNLPKPIPETQAWYIAGGAALLWLVHPLLVSTTLYAVQRMTQLSTLFIIASLLCYVAFRSRLHLRPYRNGIGMAISVGICGLLGAFSKENAALLPLYLLATEAIVFQWRLEPRNITTKETGTGIPAFNTRATRHVLAAFHTVFVFLPLAAACIYIFAKWPDLMSGYAKREFNLTERLLSEANILWLYLSDILLPRVTNMALFHDAYPIQSHLDLATAAAIAGHAALIIAAALLARTAPVLAFGIGVFYISHALESTFIPLELVFEHRNYLATWGILFTLAYYLIRTAQHGDRLIWLRYTTLAVLVGIFSLATHTRALTWEKEELLTISALEAYPNSIRALSNMANINLRRGSIKHARPYLETAIEEAPDRAGPALHMLYTYCRSDSYPQQLRDRIIRNLRTGIVAVYAQNGIYNLATLKNRDKCSTVKTEDVTDFLKAFLDNPGINNEIRYYTLLQLGRVYLADGQADAARTSFDRATQFQADAPYIHRLMALEGSVLSSLEIGDLASATDALLEIRRLAQDPRLKSIFNVTATLDNLENMDTDQLKSKVIEGTPVGDPGVTTHP